jgi:glycosyltransferase involved in cell wall biosynthesis
LEAIIRKHKLSHCVEFRGYVSDEDLQALLTHADICINLRYPSIEGASASVIEEMLYGKPVVVSDTGFYAELPSDAVMKVRLQQEQADLRAALVELLDVERRAGLGGRARAYAAETFRADRYAKDIVSFAWHVRGARPVFGLADRVASELRQMNVSADMALVDTVSAICAGLFFGHEDV